MLNLQLRSLALLLAPVLGVLLLSGVGVAQRRETSDVSTKPVTTQAQSAPESPPPAKAVRRQPRGRLPAYFSAVVSQKQRGQIYGIQSQFNERLAALRVQIDQLLAERDKEVDGVLTPEQLADVNKKRQAAAARRKSRRPSPVDTANEGRR